MQIDPATEFRRLAEEYRAKTDDELRELAADFADLTEPAQQALRQEMQSRRLGDPQAANAPSSVARTGPQVTNAPKPIKTPAASLPLAEQAQDTDTEEFDPIIGRIGAAFGARGPTLVSEAPEEVDEDGSGPRGYTWKTVLCECETTEEAQYLLNALRSAGLDGWIQAPREFGRRYARVLVAADQLEQARAIAARPIPQEVIDESKVEEPEFTPPVCPKCGADDPVLEAVDPQNTWRCEQCGEQWTEPAEVAEEKEEKAGKLPS